jgi:predicted dithiol-disulfide oxidoreductase (DUF899 family)
MTPAASTGVPPYTSTVRFPGETPEYRAARDRLLAAERDLRATTEQVAAMRRALPLGGRVPEDYVFEEGRADLSDTASVHQVKLSELFRDGLNTLVLYSFMYGPKAKQPCPMCSSMLDSLNGASPHVSQRVNVAVVAKSPITRIREFARGRRWNNLRLLSSALNNYNRDYHGEAADQSQLPSLNVFVRRGADIHHTYNTELLFAPAAPGDDARHVDAIWPLWNLFDLTPDGRGTDWYPKLSY